MPTYVTPGVYIERADAGDAAVAPLRTDIAGFVGIARRGPLDTALPVDSWRQFVSWFGDVTGAGYLAYAVRAFFENGGRRCWVVRVASRAATPASTRRALPPVVDALRVDAASPGVWGNDVEIEWRETNRAQTTADPAQSAPNYVTVASVAGFERGTHVRAFMPPGAPTYRVVSAVDADLNRLYWVNPRRPNRLNYEQPLAGYDPARSLLLESIEYTLLVRELGRLVSVVDRLSLVPAHPRYGATVLAPQVSPLDGLSPRPPLSRRAARRDRPVDEAPNPVTIVDERRAAANALLQPTSPLSPADITALLRPMASQSLPRRSLIGGLDGLSPLTVGDFLGEPASIFDDEETRRRKTRGLRALEPVGEVALVAVPDIQIQPALPPVKQPPPVCVVNPCLPAQSVQVAVPRTPSVGDLPPRFTADQIFQVQQAVVDHCTAAHDRFAILDPPFDVVSRPGLGIGPLRAWRRRFDSDLAALYAPWLMAPDPLMLDDSGLRAVPPSGHVAGFIAQTDLRLGVHRAPANGALNWVQATTLPIDDSLHGVLNPEQINAIRAFPGRGLRIFGARTLSSNADWRFVNVRRLVLMLEKAIRIGSQWATFEPNNGVTRTKLHLTLTSLLLEMWRRGALAGKTAQEAFFVNCSELENPSDQRARGMLVAEVGVAPATPFEFVVIRVAVSDNALEISESGRVEAAS